MVDVSLEALYATLEFLRSSLKRTLIVLCLLVVSARDIVVGFKTVMDASLGTLLWHVRIPYKFFEESF